MANIKLVKFTNGEEIIGDVLSQDETQLKIKQPIRIVIIPPSGPGQKPSVAFAEWIPYVDEKEFTLRNLDVSLILTPVKELIANYNEIFSSIVTPKAPKLIIS